MDEALLHFVGFLGELGRALAWVLNREPRGDDEHVFEHAFISCLE